MQAKPRWRVPSAIGHRLRGAHALTSKPTYLLGERAISSVRNQLGSDGLRQIDRLRTIHVRPRKLRVDLQPQAALHCTARNQSIPA